MNSIKLLYFLSLIILIITIESNTSSLSQEKNESEEIEKENLDDEEYKISKDEMDILLYCSVIWQNLVEKEEENIQKLISDLNITNPDPLYDRIGIDILKSCLKKVTIDDVRNHFKNLTYYKEVEINNILLKDQKIDFEGYRANPVFNLTDEEEILAYKIQKTMQLFQKKSEEMSWKIKENEENEESENVQIGKFDINKIPKIVNIIIFIVVFGLLFGGGGYLLIKLTKKKESKKKKKEKQK